MSQPLKQRTPATSSEAAAITAIRARLRVLAVHAAADSPRIASHRASSRRVAAYKALQATATRTASTATTTSPDKTCCRLKATREAPLCELGQATPGAKRKQYTSHHEKVRYSNGRATGGS